MPNIQVPKSAAVSPLDKTALQYSTNTGHFRDESGNVWFVHELAGSDQWGGLEQWLREKFVETLELPTARADFACHFDNFPTDGFIPQGVAPDRIRLIRPGRSGEFALQLRTEPGDVDPFGSKNAQRTDVYIPQDVTDGFEGREAWWAHSIMFPDDYQTPPGWGVAACFHNTAKGPGQANFHVDADKNGLGFRGYGGAKSEDGPFGRFIEPIKRQKWYDFVYYVRWSSGPDGFFHAWVNGKRYLRHFGPTLYSGQGVYLKLSNYHVTTPGASSILHDRVLRGPTADAVGFVEPVDEE